MKTAREKAIEKEEKTYYKRRRKMKRKKELKNLRLDLSERVHTDSEQDLF